jgi:hypothetical protein
MAQTLIIAGFGSMGQAFVCLYGSYLRTFQSIHIIDRTVPDSIEDGLKFHHIDVADTSALEVVLADINEPILFLNFTAGTDTVKLRTVLADYDATYIDTACSAIDGACEYSYSQLMPHTYTEVGNRKPHLLCCGLNPGLIEILIRQIIRTHFPRSNRLDICIYEHDTLTSANQSTNHLPVSWSLETLIDEVLLSPTLKIHEGQLLEGRQGPTEIVTVNWTGQTVESRLVGHEDIWNMQFLENVKVWNCSYAYAFSEAVMAVLNKGPGAAQQALYVPKMAEPIAGTDQIAIKVTDVDSGRSKMLLWQLSHQNVWNKHRVNAVQYQVCASARLFCEMINSDRFPMKPCQHAANLPIPESAWDLLTTLMVRCDIRWEEIPSRNIQ